MKPNNLMFIFIRALWMFSVKRASNLVGSRQQKFKGKLSRSLCKVRNSDVLERIWQQNVAKF